MSAKADKSWRDVIELFQAAISGRDLPAGEIVIRETLEQIANDIQDIFKNRKDRTSLFFKVTNRFSNLAIETSMPALARTTMDAFTNHVQEFCASSDPGCREAGIWLCSELIDQAILFAYQTTDYEIFMVRVTFKSIAPAIVGSLAKSRSLPLEFLRKYHSGLRHLFSNYDWDTIRAAAICQSNLGFIFFEHPVSTGLLDDYLSTSFELTNAMARRSYLIGNPGSPIVDTAEEVISRLLIGVFVIDVKLLTQGSAYHIQTLIRLLEPLVDKPRSIALDRRIFKGAMRLVEIILTGVSADTPADQSSVMTASFIAIGLRAGYFAAMYSPQAPTEFTVGFISLVKLICEHPDQDRKQMLIKRLLETSVDLLRLGDRDLTFTLNNLLLTSSFYVYLRDLRTLSKTLLMGYSINWSTSEIVYSLITIQEGFEYSISRDQFNNIWSRFKDWSARGFPNN